MKRFFLLLILPFLFITAPLRAQTTPAAAMPTTSAPTADPSLQEINTLREGLVDAFNKKDIDKLLTYLSPDVVVTWQNGEVSKGPDQVKAFYNRMMVGDSAVVDSISAAPEVEGRALSGDTSISYGHMNDTFKLKDGMEFHLDSRFSAWLVRDSGRWLVCGFHVSANVFDNEIQRTYVRKSSLWTGIAAGVGGLVLGWIIARLAGRKHEAMKA
jgi:ketosteroid isomerase-like protein